MGDRHWIANSNTPGEARIPNPRFRRLRRIDFATPEEITKSTVSDDGQTIYEGISGFAAVASFTGEGSEKTAARTRRTAIKEKSHEGKASV